jgi:hypothetical protein
MRFSSAGLLLAFLTCVGLVRAAELRWANPVNGNWGVAANWSPAQVPTAADSVSITNDGVFVVAVNVAAQAGSITLGGTSGSQTLSNLTQVLTVNGPVRIGSNGVIRLNGGTFTGLGDMGVAGRFEWSGGALNRSGVTTIDPMGTLWLAGTGSRTLTNGFIANLGQAVWGGGTILSTIGFAVFSNAPGAVLEITNTGTWNVSTSDTNALLVNAGTLRRRGPSVTTVGAMLENLGSVELLSGTLSLSSTNGYRQRDGSTTLQGGALTLTMPGQLIGGFLTGTGAITGTLTNSAELRPGLETGTLRIAGNYIQSASGALDLDLGGKDVGTNSDLLVITGTATLAGRLRVDLLDGYVPPAGTVFRSVTWASRLGTFSDVQFGFATPRLSLGYTNTAALLQTYQDAWGLNVADTAINESSAYALTVGAVPALPAYQRLTLALSGAPLGMSFNPATGSLSWTPTEAQGPGEYALTVSATDNGNPPRVVQSLFTLSVQEVNVAPGLAPIADQTLIEGGSLQVTANATDLDVPPNHLTYSLLSAPPEMTVDAGGIVRWTPPAEARDTTNRVRLVVSDDGVPSLSRTQEFAVVVLPRLLAYEGFDYAPAGSDLAGRNGGAGFAGAWEAATLVAPLSTNFDAATPTLDHQDLAVGGESASTRAIPLSAGALRRRRDSGCKPPPRSKTPHRGTTSTSCRRSTTDGSRCFARERSRRNGSGCFQTTPASPLLPAFPSAAAPCTRATPRRSTSPCGTRMAMDCPISMRLRSGPIRITPTRTVTGSTTATSLWREVIPWHRTRMVTVSTISWR